MSKEIKWTYTTAVRSSGTSGNSIGSVTNVSIADMATELLGTLFFATLSKECTRFASSSPLRSGSPRSNLARKALRTALASFRVTTLPMFLSFRTHGKKILRTGARRSEPSGKSTFVEVILLQCSSVFNRRYIIFTTKFTCLLLASRCLRALDGMAITRNGSSFRTFYFSIDTLWHSKKRVY